MPDFRKQLDKEYHKKFPRELVRGKSGIIVGYSDQVDRNEVLAFINQNYIPKKEVEKTLKGLMIPENMKIIGSNVDPVRILRITLKYVLKELLKEKGK